MRAIRSGVRSAPARDIWTAPGEGSAQANSSLDLQGGVKLERTGWDTLTSRPGEGRVIKICMPFRIGNPQQRRIINTNPADRQMHLRNHSNCCYCEVRASEVAGRGTFSTESLDAGQELFREAAFLVCRNLNGRLVSRKRRLEGAQYRDVKRAPVPSKISAELSSIVYQHKHCPPCIRLAPTDTGGNLSGSEDTYWFAKAYAASSKSTRAAVLELDTFGGGETHALVHVVQAEARVLRASEPDLAKVPADELERAIQR